MLYLCVFRRTKTAPVFTTFDRLISLHIDAHAQAAQRDVIASNRYRDWNELQYSMRSVFEYAPWVRNIYVVVASLDGQVRSKSETIIVIKYDEQI
jgi:hypothetical protein